MLTLGVHDLRAVAADFLRPLHKTLINGTLSCTLNNQFVTEFINNPLAVPRSLRSTGDFNECEYTREPDHILVSSPWHAYIPVDASYPPKDIKAWVFQDAILPLETFAPTYRRSGRVTSGFLKKVQTTIDHARSLLTTVYDVYGAPSDPLSLDYVSLQQFHGSYEELCTEVWAVRRSVLVVYGYITYCLVTDPLRWIDNSSISAEFIDAMKSSGLLDLPRRGLIIDAQNPPPFKDVVGYLRHSVPVHYYWQTDCVHWLDPTATQSVDLQQLVTPPFLTAPPPQDSFWRLGKFPPFHGKRHKERIFVTENDDVSRKEISDQPSLINELRQRCTSTLFVEPTGDVLLLYDNSGHESNTVETESGLDDAHLPDDAHLKEQPLQIRTSPNLDVIATLNRTFAVHNVKTHWIYEQFNKPYVSFDTSFQVPGIPLPDNLQFITRGRLQVSKRTQIRLELWLTQYPNVPLWLLGYRCLSLGMDWRVYTFELPPPDLERPAPHPPIAPLTFTSRTAFLLEYVQRVRILLERPHSRRFLTMGGITWRIALHYGPPSLFESTLAGPSAHAHFQSDVRSDEAIVDDCVNEAEISLLLGISEFGSIWPTLDIWERSENWTGEWSEKGEKWFQSHIHDISVGSPTSILTRQQWKSKFRQHTVTALNKTNRLGTEVHAAAVCLQLVALYPPATSINLD